MRFSLGKMLQYQDACTGGCARFLAVCVLCVLLCGCADDKPIKVGFSGQLTGTHADLGTQGRNGVQLAVEVLNAEGGVLGRSIELLVQDDLGTPEGAKAANETLIENGVVAIIGHMTSSQSMAGLPVTQKAGMVLLSPTTSTSKLENKKDLFFRVQPVVTSLTRGLARYMKNTKKLDRAAVLYDKDNSAFSVPFWAEFVREYLLQGGSIVDETGFSSSDKPDFAELVERVRATAPEGVLLVSSALDTALFAQKCQQAGWDVPLVTTGWAQTDTLLRNGGKAVEGMLMLSHNDPDIKTPIYLTFRDRYIQRFSMEPTFAATQAYDAMSVLVQALKKTKGKSEGLAEALLSIKNHAGIEGAFSMNEYGDVLRTQFSVVVKNGNFVSTGPISE